MKLQGVSLKYLRHILKKIIKHPNRWFLAGLLVSALPYVLLEYISYFLYKKGFNVPGSFYFYGFIIIFMLLSGVFALYIVSRTLKQTVLTFLGFSLGIIIIAPLLIVFRIYYYTVCKPLCPTYPPPPFIIVYFVFILLIISFPFIPFIEKT